MEGAQTISFFIEQNHKLQFHRLGQVKPQNFGS